MERLVSAEHGRSSITPSSLRWDHAVPLCIGRPRRRIEWIALDLHYAGLGWCEVGALEDSGGLRADGFGPEDVGLACQCFCFGLLFDPDGCKSPLVCWHCFEAFDIVTVPEEELEILCSVFDVDKVVHEVSGGTGLFHDMSASKIR